MASKEELAISIDQAEWSWLRSHLERGVLILVDCGIDLADTAFMIANDHAAAVNSLIEMGQISKPSSEQIVAWDADSTKLFDILIISPFVLIQER